MEVIIPCAGQSTRFPGLRPKYLLTDYQGKMMIESAAKNYIGKHNVHIVILKEHDKQYNVTRLVNEAFDGKVKIIVLDKPTNGPAETVYKALTSGSIDISQQILVKDCDGFYDSKETHGNVIYVAKLSKNPQIKTAAAKSYTTTNDQGIIHTIVEKQIVSDSFCVGGYQFYYAKDYIEAYENIKQDTEIFVSNIVDYMLQQGKMFFESEVENFIDVGVLEDWFDYNNKPTYFCDIDGTIVKSKLDYTEPHEPIQENVDFLLKELARGCQIVFTTSRPKKFHELTTNMLTDLGFYSCDLIMGLNHSKRILINDFAKSNPYPSAVAVNIKRDSKNLDDYL